MRPMHAQDYRNANARARAADADQNQDCHEAHDADALARLLVGPRLGLGLVARLAGLLGVGLAAWAGDAG